MKQVLIALSQLGNALTGGMADETISARAWRESHWLRYPIDILFFFDPQHCYHSYIAECERKQLPSHYKDCQE